MKPVVFFQCGDTQSTPWLDAVQTWNCDSDIKGYWINPKDPQSYLYHFTKHENKAVFSKNVSLVDGGDFKFAITKQFVQPEMNLMRGVNKGVEFKFLLKWFKSNEGKSIGFGSFGNQGSHADVIKNSVFYTRDPWMGGHVFDLSNGKFLTDDTNNSIPTVTWFYAYKLNNLPIYIVVFNPSIISLSDNVEFEDDDCVFRYMDPHMGSMSTQFLKPKLSKNAFPLEDKWYIVKGESFEMDVGALSTFGLALNEQISHEHLKVVSDLNITHLEGTKYKATFKKGQQSSYISIRLNTGNALDWTFINSGNRLVYNIQITKHYEENN
jgi:hypothetical protein